MSADARTRFDIVEDYWAQLLAVDERVLREAVRRAARRRLVRTLALALLGLAVAAGLAIAAKTWIFGSAAPPRFASLERIDVGRLTPGSARVLGLRVADPSGGPAWGLRLLRTSKRRICFQAGRVVGGRLVALGIAGAFNDDARAHPLPIETEGCGSLVQRRPTRFGAVSQVVTSDGSIGAIGCRVAGTGHRDGSLPVCRTGDRRTIVYGLLGKRIASVSFILGRKRLRLATPERVFLFVLRGPREVGDARFIARDTNGRECELDNPAASPEQLRNHVKSLLRPRCDSAALS
ncbi:MAG: hypothetical protein QOJ29_1797 [Thermoleophilaceae bacterium]|jgi:hypothetical protein|nr:hypothetical protein [Thermoleophilaceae bacterium]